MVLSLRSFPGMQHAAARHVAFFYQLTPELYAFLTQPRRRKYVHGRRTTEGALTLRERAAFVAQSLTLL